MLGHQTIGKSSTRFSNAQKALHKGVSTVVLIFQGITMKDAHSAAEFRWRLCNIISQGEVMPNGEKVELEL